MQTYWDIRQLAEYLNVKPATLYAWAAQGKIPSLKLHGLLRFRQDEIDQWLESCRVESRPAVTVPRNRRQRPVSNVDALIERAKRVVYTPKRGNQHSEPIQKGDVEWDS
ncbi:MAG: helix-turn-helix domain-containing protein [Nitrospira sp.]|nr:helix-turn-helix domain-containing protein [Nitrospira sp.]